MDVRDKIYINGAWVPSTGTGVLEVINSTTEEVMATIPDGTAEDVDKAVQAAAAAFPAWAATSREERGKLLVRIGEALSSRTEEIATIISQEVGMPMTLSGAVQVGLPAGAFADAASAAEHFPWEEEMGNSLIVREPVGVVGAITPWNYPLYQVVLKVAPALAAGCTVVLKPSEVAPLNAFALADIIHEVGLPAGVFNLVTGVGPVVGEAIAAHPKVDMVSFTGSTRAGKRVMELAADTIKRVSLELGGKSANILLDDADLATAVPAGVFACYM
ncbi:MAG TPA: aldehyde dehydrogenase family protein, partial [Acidimicrobiales bacterium]